jgi:hypothetical protein
LDIAIQKIAAIVYCNGEFTPRICFACNNFTSVLIFRDKNPADPAKSTDGNEKFARPHLVFCFYHHDFTLTKVLELCKDIYTISSKNLYIAAATSSTILYRLLFAKTLASTPWLKKTDHHPRYAEHVLREGI